MLTHGCRFVDELAYQDIITEHLPNNEYFGELVRERLIYYPTVTREQFHNQGRLTTLMTSGQQLAKALASIDRTRTDMVVWVQFLLYRELGGAGRLVEG